MGITDWLRKIPIIGRIFGKPKTEIIIPTDKETEPTKKEVETTEEDIETQITKTEELIKKAPKQKKEKAIQRLEKIVKEIQQKPTKEEKTIPIKETKEIKIPEDVTITRSNVAIQYWNLLSEIRKKEPEEFERLMQNLDELEQIYGNNIIATINLINDEGKNLGNIQTNNLLPHQIENLQEDLKELVLYDEERNKTQITEIIKAHTNGKANIVNYNIPESSKGEKIADTRVTFRMIPTGR